MRYLDSKLKTKDSTAVILSTDSLQLIVDALEAINPDSETDETRARNIAAMLREFRTSVVIREVQS